jgi:hypothetical protein
MIGCFDFILHVCIYLNMMKCQFIIDGKKAASAHRRWTAQVAASGLIWLVD